MGYWVVTAVVLFIGLLTGFTIGVFVLPVGLAMLVLGRFRRRPEVFWPPLIGVIGLVIGYALVTPWTCATSGTAGGISTTTCTSALGISYVGSGSNTPSGLPGLEVGLILGLVAAAAVLLAIRLREVRRG